MNYYAQKERELHNSLLNRANTFIVSLARYEPELINSLEREELVNEAVYAQLSVKGDWKAQMRIFAKNVRKIRFAYLKILDKAFVGGSKERSIYTDEELDWAEGIIQFYEKNTYQETLFAFRLKDSNTLRKMLSDIAPKHGRKSGKEKGAKYKKITITPSSDLSHLPKTTAWRAKKRGWYYQKQ